MAAAWARAAEMASAPAERARKGTVVEHTVTTVSAGNPTRRSRHALLDDRGVEWLLARSTSVTMGDILIEAFQTFQTVPMCKRVFLVIPMV